jgi:hypothetical protein
MKDAAYIADLYIATFEQSVQALRECDGDKEAAV